MKRLKEEVAKETPKFKDLLEKVMTVGSSQESQLHLRQRLDEFKKLLFETRLSLIRVYQKVCYYVVDDGMSQLRSCIKRFKYPHDHCLS